jgi:hypothetical protein
MGIWRLWLCLFYSLLRNEVCWCLWLSKMSKIWPYSVSDRMFYKMFKSNYERLLISHPFLKSYQTLRLRVHLTVGPDANKNMNILRMSSDLSPYIVHSGFPVSSKNPPRFSWKYGLERDAVSRCTHHGTAVILIPLFQFSVLLNQMFKLAFVQQEFLFHSSYKFSYLCMNDSIIK